MNRKEWMTALERELAPLDQTERNKALSFYSELYNDRAESGMNEADILGGFGDPRAAAQEILQNNGTSPESAETSDPFLSESVSQAEHISAAPPAEPKVSPKPKKTNRTVSRVFLRIVLPVVLGILLLYLLIAGICTIVDWNTREEKVYESATVFDSLELNSDASDIRIVRGDSFRVTYCVSAFTKVDVEETTVAGESVFRLTQRRLPLTLGMFSSEITVTVPFVSAIAVSSSSGSIRIEGAETTSLTVSLSSGSLTVRDSSVDRMTLRLSSGSASLTDSVVSSYSAELSSGTVNIERSTLDQCALKLSSGSANLKYSAVNDCSATLSSGSCNFEELSVGQSLRLKLTSGNVGGSIVGSEKDFSVLVSLTSGSSNLHTTERDGAEKSITAELTSGRLNLTFTEDS